MTGWLSLHRRPLAAGLAAIVLVIGVAMLLERLAMPAKEGPELSVHSTVESGARALYLWLAESGYETSVLEYRAFAIDPEARVMFVLAPGPTLSEGHASEIVEWIDRGGTLVLVSERPSPLLDRLGVRIEAQGVEADKLVVSEPFSSRGEVREVRVGTVSTLAFTLPEWRVGLRLADGNGAVGATAQLGAGRVFLLAAEHPLSNGGLLEADNWALARLFLSDVSPGSGLVFDEYHHGHTEHGTLYNRMVQEPWGWGLLSAAAMLALYVVLTGSRFGPPVPAMDLGKPRTRSEYVATMAAMLRRGGHRDWLCREFAGQTKRDLGARYWVQPDLSASRFVAALERAWPGAADLAAPLRRLEEGPIPDDATALALVREVVTIRTRQAGRMNEVAADIAGGGEP